RLRSTPQPSFSATVPEAPHYLSEYAIEEWRRLAPGLHSLRLLAEIDHAAFAVYCSNFALWRLAEEASKDATDPVERQRFNEIAARACKETIQSGAVFGLSRAGRARMGGFAKFFWEGTCRT